MWLDARNMEKRATTAFVTAIRYPTHSAKYSHGLLDFCTMPKRRFGSTPAIEEPIVEWQLLCERKYWHGSHPAAIQGIPENICSQ